MNLRPELPTSKCGPFCFSFAKLKSMTIEKMALHGKYKKMTFTSPLWYIHIQHSIVWNREEHQNSRNFNFFFCFWDMGLLCSSGWPWTPDLLPTISQCLGYRHASPCWVLAYPYKFDILLFVYAEGILVIARQQRWVTRMAPDSLADCTTRLWCWMCWGFQMHFKHYFIISIYGGGGPECVCTCTLCMQVAKEASRRHQITWSWCVLGT